MELVWLCLASSEAIQLKSYLAQVESDMMDILSITPAWAGTAKPVHSRDCRCLQARALYASRHRQAEQLTISRLGIMPDDEAEAWSNLRVRNAALSAADHDYAECLPRINICTVAPCLARR